MMTSGADGTGWLLTRLALAVSALLIAACAPPGYPDLASHASPGGTYVVRLSGRVTRALFLEHRVRAEVYKNGALHLPARLIYVAGFMDIPFADRFAQPQWVAGNVLRFPAGAPSGGGPDSLIVRNVSPKPFRSVRVETATDMFMLLDLEPGALTTCTMTAAGDPSWFDVLVDSGHPDTLLRGHGTFPRDPSRRGVRTFTVDVSANGVQVAERH